MVVLDIQRKANPSGRTDHFGILVVAASLLSCSVTHSLSAVARIRPFHLAVVHTLLVENHSHRVRLVAGRSRCNRLGRAQGYNRLDRGILAAYLPYPLNSSARTTALSSCRIHLEALEWGSRTDQTERGAPNWIAEGARRVRLVACRRGC